MEETIFALSSGHGRAGVAVVRVSGPAADATLLLLSGRLPVPRHATLMTIKDVASEEILDRCLVLRFLAEASFTGELCFELHLHGGRAVIQSVLRVLGEQKGLRLAKAGEFTRRALENGKLDLTQIEALGDLIEADTEMQRRQALRGLEGALGIEVRRWRECILGIKALIAAEIDFSDEGDVGENVAHGIDSDLERLEKEFSAALASSERGRIITDGFRIAIIGEPNAGKSTLLNTLAASDVAIVTEYAGTTRDVLEVRLDIEGYPVVLLDTAGLRQTSDPVERIGIQRANDAAATADLVLLLSETSAFVALDENSVLHGFHRIKSIRIRTKQDYGENHGHEGAIAISSKTGFGLIELRQAILSEIKSVAFSAEPLVVTRERQRIAITSALAHCQCARSSIPTGIEFIDEDIRLMDTSLASLLGLTGVEEVLGEIFSRFCVGK